MQSNGIFHANGTRSSGEFAVNGLGGVVTSNGCDGDLFEGEEAVKMGASAHVEKVLSRKRKQRQLTGKDRDVIRLVGQHLREMGFVNTLSSLVEESGCPLEHPKAANFRSHVIAGEWDEANKSLDNLVPLLEDSSNIERMRLLLLQEKYLELLEGGREIEALQCLRHELALVPLHHSDKKLQVLTSYMMYSDKELLRKAADWPGLRGGAREQLMDKLQGYLPSSVMLPPRRLQQLLDQAIQLQEERCPFHYLDQDSSQYSLLNDHMCTRSQFPSESVHVLNDHSEEVWYVKFSHDGSMLASGSKDGQVIIWKTDGPRPTKYRTLKAQSDGIAVLDWSPDDSLLLCCGRDDNPEVLVFSTETGEVKCQVNHPSDANLSCCAWHNSGTKFYVGGTRGQFLECLVDGSVTASWEGIRIQAIATHPSSDNVYAADTHHRIRRYNFHEKSSCTLVQENHSIMSFTLSKNGRNALLNIATQGIHLWDLQDRCLLRRFQGITQSLYAIYSCYGGIQESFIASGSEDHHVYIWHHRRETPVIILKGHSRAVNCVDWNSANPTMLASGSDDGVVRLWGTKEQMKAEQRYQKEIEHLKEMQQDSAQEEDPLLGSSAVSHHHSRPNDPDTSGEGENMDIQPSEASQSSETDPQASEMERIESNTSSLSLSSLRPVILDSLDSRRERSESGHSLSSVGSWVLPRSGDGGSAHLSSLDFGSSARSVGESGSGSRTGLSLAHESSLDLESSQLSQDSSNGSSSQPDELNEEDPPLSLVLDSRPRYRTGSESPGTSTPVERTPSQAQSPSTPLIVAGRGSGESVIVGRRSESGANVSSASGAGGDDEGLPPLVLSSPLPRTSSTQGTGVEGGISEETSSTTTTTTSSQGDNMPTAV